MTDNTEKSRTETFYIWLSKNPIGFSFTVEDVLPVFKMSRPSMIMVLDRFTSVGVLKHENGKYRFVKHYTGKFHKAKKSRSFSNDVLPKVVKEPAAPTNELTPMQQMILYVESLEQEVKNLRQLLVSKYTA